ncbi:MAG: hypothetical protein Q7V58_09495 [Actinomycetota bacterium]|nr:hypothetical protein [Actinomycetota bacterium]
MAQPSPDLVIRAHRAAMAQVRDRVAAYALTAWAAQRSYRDADVDRLVRLITPRVEAGQVQVANLTAVYIAQVAALRGAKGVQAALVDRAVVTGGRGIPAADVYRRPATEVYTALAQGKSFGVAKELGAARLGSLVRTDLQMAQVRQADASYRSAGVRFYQRILGPGNNCALCVIASTQRYRVGDLLPIHPGCGCSTDDLEPGTPVYAARDGGERVIDPKLLEDTHARVAQFAGEADRGGRSPDYRQLIVTREHGEYGPTLSWRSDRFTGPDDL